jgi:hypothetical protein
MNILHQDIWIHAFEVLTVFLVLLAAANIYKQYKATLNTPTPATSENIEPVSSKFHLADDDSIILNSANALSKPAASLTKPDNNKTAKPQSSELNEYIGDFFSS